MASSGLPNPRGTKLDKGGDDTSIITGFSKQELLDLFKTSEITSWDGVFYHIGLPLPESGEEKSAESLGIIAKLLTVWKERGDSSRSQLLDMLDKLHERDLASSVETDALRRPMRGLEQVFDVGQHFQFSLSLGRNFRERLALAKAKLSAYLSSHLAAIPTSNEPVETLAKSFLEGCFTEMDFSTVQEKVAILLEAVKEAGFDEVPQRFELDEIVACFKNKEQLLSMVNSLTKQGPVDKHLTLPDMGSTGLRFEFIQKFYTWKQFALERMSRNEWKSTLQGALREAGVPASIYEQLDEEYKVTSWDVHFVAAHLPVEKAEDLGLALGFHKEEVDILQTLTMSTYHTYHKLCLLMWSKRTQFSRHKLFLALCLSGYSTFATSNLYGMNPADVYVTKSFGRSGGEVNLEDEGIQLSIPMGALPENQRITFHLLEEGPPIPSADLEEVSICPGFRVAPSGLSFHSRIKVTMDHSATILQQDRADKEGIVVYVRQEEGPKEQWKVVRYDLSTSTDCPVEVVLTNDKVELYLTHFTSFWVRIKRAFIKNKRIACTPFLPKYMPANWKPVLRLYIHRISRGTVKMIQEEEKNSCPVYQQTTPHDQFLVIPNGQDLTVICDDEGRIISKMVSSENLLTLRRQARNRLEFELDFSSLRHGDKNVKVDLFQGVEKNRKEMIIPTTFKGILSKEHRRLMDQNVTSPNTVSPIPNLPGMGKPSFDDMLKIVAKKVVQNSAIDDLGVALGVDVEDILCYIEMNHRYQNITNDGTLQMLRDWRKRQTESTECLALKRALEESGNIRLADDLFGKGMERSGGDQSDDETIGLEREPRQSRKEPCVSEGEIFAGLDTLHLESTQDMALSGACASASLDEVTYEQLVDIAVAIPGESFVTFFVHLGFDIDYPLKVLERWGRSYRSASEELLSEWARNHQNDKDLLRKALRNSKLQFLAFQYLPS